MQSISKIFRVLSTGISFIIFMIWGLSLGGILYPLLVIFIKDRQKRQTKFMFHMNKAWKNFTKFMQITRAIGKVEVEGLENINTSKTPIIIANHNTLLDIVLLGANITNFNCVVKQALWKHPFLGLVMRGSGFIPNTGGEDFINRCQDGLNQNRPLIIFPEGSRALPDEPIKFHRGASQIIVRTDSPIIPVTIICTPITLQKDSPWYNVPSSPPNYKIKIHKQIVIPNEISNETVTPKKVRKLNTHIETQMRNLINPN